MKKGSMLADQTISFMPRMHSTKPLNQAHRMPTLTIGGLSSIKEQTTLKKPLRIIIGPLKFPRILRFYLKRGNTYCKLKQYQLAIKDFTKVIRMEPANAEALFDRAITYMQMGEYQLAVDDYDSFISLKPDYADAYTYRGISYYYQGKHSFCYRDALRASKLGNDALLEIFKEDMTPL